MRRTGFDYHRDMGREWGEGMYPPKGWKDPSGMISNGDGTWRSPRIWPFVVAVIGVVYGVVAGLGWVS